MSRRHTKKRPPDNPLMTAVIIMALLIVGGFFQLNSQRRSLVLVGVTTLLLVAVAIIFYVELRRQHKSKKRLQMLQLIDIDTMSGLDFEKYVAEVLGYQGYEGIQLTEYYDWGVDIIATKQGVRWGIQVKRRRGLVRAEAVRQVVTALKKYKCERAMVVTNSTYTRQARELARSNDCRLVDGNELADWMAVFQKA